MTITAPQDLSRLRVLVVDDEPDIRLGLRRLAGAVGARVSEASDGLDAMARLKAEGADIVLTDLMMPRMSGAELLAEIKRRAPETAVVILTGYGTVQSAVGCLQNGAAHFLTKPFDNEEVKRLIQRLGRQILARRTDEAGAQRVGEQTFIAEDPRTKAVLELVSRVAATRVPVLIEGESGTGKELIARALHERSHAADKAFLAVNAAALPDTLLESELFGHARGAFTGANQAHEGLFAQAQGGTVFLDEVSSMSHAFQVKLLRVLQEQVVRPLGGDRDLGVNFRSVAATNRDLEAMMQVGAFREDLFYRLGVMRVHIPPLRDRPGDIPAMAQHFLREAAVVSLGSDASVPELSAAAHDALYAHPWPGNARELKNAIQRAVITCVNGRIEPWNLGLETCAWQLAEPPQTAESLDYQSGKQRALEEFQREFVSRVLERAGGNVSHAAEASGMTRAALQRILRQLDIDRRAFE